MPSPRYGFIFLLIILLAACARVPAPPTPTVIPFPTVTVGRQYEALLPPITAVPGQTVPLANPATVAALANQPTPTPDFAACPANHDVSLGERPNLLLGGEGVANEITRFLTAGGSVAALREQLRDDWGLLREDTILRSDVDLTGEGIPEIVLTFNAPPNAGYLQVFGCTNGRYELRHQVAVNEGEAPEVVWLGDLNFDGKGELVYATTVCEAEDTCEFETQVLTWDEELGRFVSLLPGGVRNFSLPTLNDIDQDQVAEIVLNLDTRGTRTTGPLRTGVNIYDWNGQEYILSIVQLDPPRFRIQVIHEADRFLSRMETANAAALYEQALNDPDLRYWFNDGPVTLPAYTLYRLLLTYAISEDPRVVSVIERINEDYPELEDAPVYIQMAVAFRDVLTETNSPRTACAAVLDIVEEQPEALDLLNRYGSRNPKYTAEALCPF